MEQVGFVKSNGAGEILFRQGHPANFSPPWRPVYAHDEDDAPADAVERVTYGLRYAAERQGLNLHGYDVEKLARVALVHATGSGALVEYGDHKRALDAAKEEGDRAMRRWSAAYADTDRQLCAIKVGVVDLLTKLGQDLLGQAEKIDKGGLPSRRDG